MESSIAEFLMRQLAFEQLPTLHVGESIAKEVGEGKHTFMFVCILPTRRNAQPQAGCSRAHMHTYTRTLTHSAQATVAHSSAPWPIHCLS